MSSTNLSTAFLYVFLNWSSTFKLIWSICFFYFSPHLNKVINPTVTDIADISDAVVILELVLDKKTKFICKT